MAAGAVGKSLGGIYLSEPGGVCIHPNGDLLFIADTNNHSIKVFSLSSGELSEVRIDNIAIN